MINESGRLFTTLSCLWLLSAAFCARFSRLLIDCLLKLALDLLECVFGRHDTRRLHLLDQLAPLDAEKFKHLVLVHPLGANQLEQGQLAHPIAESRFGILGVEDVGGDIELEVHWRWFRFRLSAIEGAKSN